MISTKEKVVTGLAELNDTQLQTVAEFLEFLKFRERRKFETQFDDAELETLYAEFADEAWLADVVYIETDELLRLNYGEKTPGIELWQKAARVVLQLEPLIKEQILLNQ